MQPFCSQLRFASDWDLVGSSQFENEKLVSFLFPGAFARISWVCKQAGGVGGASHPLTEVEEEGEVVEEVEEEVELATHPPTALRFNLLWWWATTQLSPPLSTTLPLSGTPPITIRSQHMLQAYAVLVDCPEVAMKSKSKCKYVDLVDQLLQFILFIQHPMCFWNYILWMFSQILGSNLTRGSWNRLMDI